MRAHRAAQFPPSGPRACLLAVPRARHAAALRDRAPAYARRTFQGPRIAARTTSERAEGRRREPARRGAGAAGRACVRDGRGQSEAVKKRLRHPSPARLRSRSEAPSGRATRQPFLASARPARVVRRAAPRRLHEALRCRLRAQHDLRLRLRLPRCTRTDASPTPEEPRRAAVALQARAAPFKSRADHQEPPTRRASVCAWGRGAPRANSEPMAPGSKN
jgi:hypothetical protein